jgi:hypothetical protein
MTCEVCGDRPVLAGETRCYRHPKVTAWDWTPAELWQCPHCAATWLTRERRCGRCGGREE